MPEPPVMVDGERVQVRPVEFVTAESVTVPVNPFTGVMVIVELPGMLASTETLIGLADIVKSFARITVTW